MEYIYNYADFLLRTITILVSILIIIASIASQKKKTTGELHAECLNEKFTQDKEKLIKKFKLKQEKKEKKPKLTERPKAFILDFNGDIKASQSQQLREEVTAVLAIIQPNDEVMMRIESPGGAVNGYGFAASQIERLRKHNVHISVCIDQVAASGGYLMACVAHKIFAAPFSIIGSIGVVAQLPNLHKWLKKHDIDFEQITAGEYKRTLTVFGENTNEGRKKFTEDLEQIHQKFKNVVTSYRPHLQIDKVATGEHWLASDAIELGLVDELKTSDDWLMEKAETHQLILINKLRTQSLSEKLLKPASLLYKQLISKLCV
jgi:serine protease SohB